MRHLLKSIRIVQVRDLDGTWLLPFLAKRHGVAATLARLNAGEIHSYRVHLPADLADVRKALRTGTL